MTYNDDFLNTKTKMKALQPYEFEYEGSTGFRDVALVVIGAGFGMAALAGLRACDGHHVPSTSPSIASHQTDCIQCHHGVSKQRVQLERYFTKHKVDHPAMLATAVMETKRPKLMAAMAVKESPRQKTGDGGQSKGYFQVKPAHWSHLLHENRVSKDAVTQALDSQRVLDALIAENGGSLKRGLNAYGGSTTGSYAKMILAELQRVN